MENKLEQLEKTVQLQQHLLEALIKSDRYTFQRDIQLLAGRNFQFDTETGSKIGTTATEKLAFWGATPVIRPTAVADAVDAGGTYSQSVAQDAVNSLNDLLAKLRIINIIAS